MGLDVSNRPGADPGSRARNFSPMKPMFATWMAARRDVWFIPDPLRGEERPFGVPLDELPHRWIGRRLNFRRGSDRVNPALVEHRDPIGDMIGAAHVVRHGNRGDPEAPL